MKIYVVYVLVFILALSAGIFLSRRTHSSENSEQTTAVVPSPPDFKPEVFLGELIKLDHPWPSKIKSIDVSILFPPMCKFLTDAHSYLKISSPATVLKQWDLSSTQQRLDFQEDLFNDPIRSYLFKDSDHLVAELGIFYCKEGQDALCLAQKVRFDIPIQKSEEFRDVSLSYQVSDDKF